MHEITTTLKTDNIGRVMIPKHIRDAMGIEPGDLVEITIKRGFSAKSESSALNPQMGAEALVSA